MALPMQSITLSSHAILAPSFATTLSFDVAANCEWQIFVTGNDDGWAELSQVSATGTATVSVMVDENTTAQSRSLTIRAVAKRNADVTDELIFEQASASAEGYLSIPELRALAADGDYTVVAKDASGQAVAAAALRCALTKRFTAIRAKSWRSI